MLQNSIVIYQSTKATSGNLCMSEVSLISAVFDIIPEFPQKLRTIKVLSEVRCRTESDHKTLKNAESPTEHCKILAT